MNNWLYLEHYVEVTFDNINKTCLLYNTLDYSKIILKNYNFEIIKKIYNNRYSLKQSKADLKDNNTIIKILKNKFLGVVLLSKKKPFIFYPIINVQRDLKKFDKISYRQQGYNILENLFEMIIYINGQSNNYYEEIHKLIIAGKNSNLVKLTIDIKNYIIDKNNINNFLLQLLDLKYIYVIKISYTDYNDLKYNFAKIDNFTIKIIYESFTENEILFNEPNTELVFNVSNETNYYKILNSLTNKIKNFSFEPDIENCKFNFLKKFIFLNKTEILKINLNKKNYDANKILNKNLFGKLIIRDNKIYNAEINGDYITTLNLSLDLKQILYKSMIATDIWFLTREKVKPCKNCIFKFLCPPISKYELTLNKFNFCNNL